MIKVSTILKTNVFTFDGNIDEMKWNEMQWNEKEW